MALVKGTNSYATVEEAESYFADRLDVAAWVEADATQRAQSLVTATGILDDQAWIGTAITETQPLAFPRSGTYYDPRIGAPISMEESTPLRIVKACFELAYHLLNNDGLMDDTGSMTNLSVSSINLSAITAPNLIPATVKRLIQPLKVNAGSNSWWRAN